METTSLHSELLGDRTGNVSINHSTKQTAKQFVVSVLVVPEGAEDIDLADEEGMCLLLICVDTREVLRGGYIAYHIYAFSLLDRTEHNMFVRKRSIMT